ncbi:MAG: hypothetical protein ABFS42_12375 [Candidatus Krumholzibacteriota bacterium]
MNGGSRLSAGPSLALLALTAIILLMGVGCGDSEEGLGLPQNGLPNVTGIYLRDYNAEPIGLWGNPKGHGVEAYPNPSNSPFTISFQVPEPMYVDAWVHRALGPGETAVTGNAGIGGAVVDVHQQGAVKVLLSEVISAGVHQVHWGGRDDAGVEQPTGFYRIYFRFGETLHFDDVYLAREYEDLLPGMEPRYPY